MIESLTKEQEAMLEADYQEGLRIGRDITPIEHAKAEEIITRIYASHKREKPAFLYYSSPTEALEKVRAMDPDNKIEYSDFLGGQHYAYWKIYYKFAEKIGVKYDEEGQEPVNSKLLDLWYQECKTLFWWAPFDYAAIIVERPTILAIDLTTGNLHSETGPAIAFRDGVSLYYLNGVAVPEYLVMTPSEKLDLNWYTQQTNADVKAEFVRKYGVERMCEKFGKIVDSYKKYPKKQFPKWHASEYEVWDMQPLFPELDHAYYLKMLNQTTGIWHMEGLSPKCNTIDIALTERFGKKRSGGSDGSLNIVSVV